MTDRVTQSCDARIAFERGDFARAAQGDAGHWQTGAALALLGLCERAVDLLADRDEPEARFFLAAARWIEGDEWSARELLEGQSSLPARRLARLLRKPKIKVLCQLPWSRTGVQTVLDGIAGDDRFEIANHSFHPDDRPNRPYANVHEWYDADDPPDFYLVQMLEWHQVPINIHEAPFPTFAQTSDTDLHVQCVRRWLNAFDCLLALDQTEHDALSQLAPLGRTATAPLCFGWRPAPDLPAPRRHRDIDVFISGTVFDPYHPDKAVLVAELLRGAPDAKILVVDGFVPQREYFELLARSRTTLCYYRKPGGMLTRAIDALCMGSIPLLPDESILRLYLRRHPLPRYYGPGVATLSGVVRKALLQKTAVDGQTVAAIRQLFDARRTASRYLREIAVLASLLPGRSLRAADPLRDQRRFAAFKGWLVDTAHCEALRAASRARWTTIGEPGFHRAPDAAADAHKLNLLAREYVLQYTHDTQSGAPDGRHPKRGDLRQALMLFERLVRRCDDRLVPRFNFARSLLYFAESEAQRRAAELAFEEIQKRPEEQWLVSVDDDVFPHDFFPRRFNYRGYFDDLSRCPLGDEDAQVVFEKSARRRILASVSHHLGELRADRGQLRRACELDPDFATYALDLAAASLAEATQPEIREGTQICVDLVRTSWLSWPAYELLREACGFVPEELRGELRAALAQVSGIHRTRRTSVLGVEAQATMPRRDESSSSSRDAPDLSVLVLDFGARATEPMRFATLVRDALGARSEVIVCRAFSFFETKLHDGIRICAGDPDLATPSVAAVLRSAAMLALAREVVLVTCPDAGLADHADLLRTSVEGGERGNITGLTRLRIDDLPRALAPCVRVARTDLTRELSESRDSSVDRERTSHESDIGPESRASQPPAPRELEPSASLGRKRAADRVVMRLERILTAVAAERRAGSSFRRILTARFRRRASRLRVLLRRRRS